MDTQTFEFNPDSERFSSDPYSDYAWLREHAPVFDWSARGALVVSGMAELRTYFGEPRLSADAREWELYPGDALFEQPRYAAWRRIKRAGVELAPADHARVRKLASRALTPTGVRQMEATVQAAVDQAIAELLERDGEVVNICEFAERIPLEVMCRLLGVPDAFRDQFRRFAQAMIRSLQPFGDIEVLNGIADAVAEGVAMLEQMIGEARSASVRPDNLLGAWVEANEDDERLSDDEMMALVAVLIIAGTDTTVHGTCYAIHGLLSHPEALRELQAEPELLRGAIEETLRWDGFGKLALMRYATESFELCGTPVRKGQMVIGLGGAANRDPKVFSEPDRFDIRRDPQANITFGHGRRYCLGANLARTEMMLAVRSLLIERFPEAELAGPVVIDHRNPILRAMTLLPLRLGPDHGARG